jgi:mannosyl-oligosaccharide alpha-1,3-glucosidase
VRWYQAAAYQPFYRSHAALDTKRREPYLLPKASLDIVRDAIGRRYSLLPLWYTMFYEHERSGSPVMRPMLSEFPMDSKAFKLDDQYMLSDKLLVKPVMTKGVTEVNVYIPSTDGGSESAIWYDCDDYTIFDSVGEKTVKVDMNKIPVYQRGGTIVPKKETVRMASALMTNDPYTLIIALDKRQHAHGTLYIDDEKSFDYRRGKYLYINFEFHDGKLTNHFIDPANFTTRSKIEKIVIAGFKSSTPEKATLESFDGKETDLEIESSSELSFVIKTSDLTLMNEWTITVSGAIQSLICVSLLALVLMVHTAKHFMN